MSSGAELTLAQAEIVATTLLSALRPGCERIEIAGSIRRRCATVRDVEIVAVPRLARDLFGERDGAAPTELDAAVDAWIERGYMRPRAPRRMGPRFRALELVEGVLVADGTRALRLPAPVAVDLFLVLPPAQWGAVFAIRTGPWEYSRELVTRCRARGLRCVDGHLERVGATRDPVLATPEERDFIEACGLPYVEPERRRA